MTLVCKQILSLVETNGFAFDEIGVVGRTLVPYQASLKRTFDQHRIPFLSSATVPLLQEPSAKTLLHVARLKGSGLHRPAMLDVMTSPWNRRLTADRGGVEPRPELWRSAVLDNPCVMPWMVVSISSFIGGVFPRGSDVIQGGNGCNLYVTIITIGLDK